MADPQQKVDFSEYQTTPPPGAKPPAGAGVPSFGDTLGREVKAFGSAVNPVNFAKGVYHSFADPATSEEKQQYADFEKQNHEAPGTETSGMKRVGLGIDRLLVRPVSNAVEWYNDAAHGKHGDLSSVESQMLDVAPEAIGSAAGNVVLMKGGQGVLNTAKAGMNGVAPALKTAGTEFIGDTRPGTVGGNVPLPFRGVTTPLVRGAVRGVNTATQKLPEVAGATLGAAGGELVAGPKGAAVGTALGAGLGRAVRGVIPEVPGEDFGLTTMQKAGVKEPGVLRIQDQSVTLPNGKRVSKADYDSVIKPSSGMTPTEVMKQRLVDPKTSIENDVGNLAQVLKSGTKPVRPNTRAAVANEVAAKSRGSIVELPNGEKATVTDLQGRMSERPGFRGVKTPEPIVEDAHPVRMVRDENGNVLSEDAQGNQTDGRHRIMQAVERGDKTVAIQTKMRDGSYQTLNVDPKVAAQEFGVTKESLAATDAKQPWRQGNLQPREPVLKPVSKTDVSNAVDKSLGVKPLERDVPLKDQFKAGGEADDMMSKPVKESSSRGETQAFIDHGLTKAEGARLTKVLDQLDNAKFGEFAARNGTDMGQNIVSRGSVNRGLSLSRGTVVKDMLSRGMSPSEIEAAVAKHLGKK